MASLSRWWLLTRCVSEFLWEEFKFRVEKWYIYAKAYFIGAINTEDSIDSSKMVRIHTESLDAKKRRLQAKAEAKTRKKMKAHY